MLEKMNEMSTKLYVKLQLAKTDAKNTFQNEEGQTTVEYGLIIVVIVAAVGIAAGIFHEELGAAFETIMGKVHEMIG